MPDTGAPHFIPFADPTDLVRDWPALSEDVAEAVADGLDEAGNAGIGSNVVQTVKTDPFTLTSTTYTDIPDFEVKITPSSADAKILLVVHIVTGVRDEGTGPNMRLTGGNTSGFIGDALSTAERTSFSAIVGTGGGSGADFRNSTVTASAVFLDLPNTTSEVTYTVEARVPSGIGYINRPERATAGRVVAPSTITAIEVAP